MDSIIGEFKNLLISLISSPQLAFDDRLHASLPEKGGVYRIFEKGAIWQNSIHVGEAGNLRQRIYTNQLHGDEMASSVKKKLIGSGKCKDMEEARQYLKDRCFVQYIFIEDESLRKFFEHFATSILKPS